MAKSLKEYLSEKGVNRTLALELDEIFIALNARTTRLKRQGAEKSHVLIETGKYRHLEQRSPQSLVEMLRVVLDLTLLTLNFNDRFRILESYGVIKLNCQTAEYEITEFGKQFLLGRSSPA